MVTSPNPPPSSLPRLVIGTRGSSLAMWQANAVRDQVRARFPGLDTVLEVIKPEGDVDKTSSLLQIGGRGVFASALQERLLAGAVDVAVHSTKDVPTIEPVGLAIAAFPEREDAHDVVVSRHGVGLAELPPNPVIGTSSRRRAVQVRKLRPDATIVDLRGNIDTRLRKAESTDYDAVILAAAGLTRMGWRDRITESLRFESFVPSPGQGALAVEARVAPDPAWVIAVALNDSDVELAVRLERAFLQTMGGGCTTPIGAHAEVAGNLVRFWAMLASDDGARVSHVYEEIPAATAHAAVPALATRMMTDLARSWSGGTHASQPLAGKQALVTGTGDFIARLTPAFVTEAAPVLACPTLDVLPASDPQALQAALERAANGDYDWLVITSRQTIPALEAFGPDRLAGKARIAVVGNATASAVEAAGLVVGLAPGEQTGKGLLAAFEAIDLAGKRALCLLGNQAGETVPAGLAARGASVDRVESYATRAVESIPAHARDAILAGAIDIVLFASPASVRVLASQLGAGLAALSGACLAAIGPTTSEAMTASGLPVHVVAAQPAPDHVVADIRDYFATRFG